MRRFRVINPRFDTRAAFLAQEIGDHWEEHIKRQWQENQAGVVEGIAHEFGPLDLDVKVDRLVSLGTEPFSVIAFHNVFLRECRYAFVHGSFYPALTGACALGERVLNHLLLALRDDFKVSPHYKTVYDKESFDNWDKIIAILTDWDVFAPGAADAFAELKVRRNAALHFNPAVDHDAATIAHAALLSLQAAVERQFGTGAQPWFIPDAPYHYVRAEAEGWPFVRRVILASPSVAEVGPRAKLEFAEQEGAFVVSDIGDAGADVGTDEEFVALVKTLAT